MLHQRITESAQIGIKALAVFHDYFILLLLVVVVFVKYTCFRDAISLYKETQALD